MQEEIINRVAQSPLITFDLADYWDAGERVELDIKDQLFRGMILREKDFRAWVKEHDWSQYQGKYLAVFCSIDAIIPVWAYMLIATRAEPFAKFLVFGSVHELNRHLFEQALSKIDFQQFQGKKIVVKGCGDIDVPTAVYVDLTRRLRPYADKIMYGEPCSTVPLYKKPKAATALKKGGAKRPKPKIS